MRKFYQIFSFCLTIILFYSIPSHAVEQAVGGSSASAKHDALSIHINGVKRLLEGKVTALEAEIQSLRDEIAVLRTQVQTNSSFRSTLAANDCPSGEFVQAVNNNGAPVCVDKDAGRDCGTVRDGESATFYSRTSVAYNRSCSSYSQTRTCTDGTLSGSSSYRYDSCSREPAPARQSCTSGDGRTVSHGQRLGDNAAVCSRNECGSSYPGNLWLCNDGVFTDPRPTTHYCGCSSSSESSPACPNQSSGETSCVRGTKSGGTTRYVPRVGSDGVRREAIMHDFSCSLGGRTISCSVSLGDR